MITEPDLGHGLAPVLERNRGGAEVAEEEVSGEKRRSPFDLPIFLLPLPPSLRVLRCDR
jgi:hypothetical protein